MADLRHVLESQVASPDPPAAVLWQRRALLHLHARELLAAGIPLDSPAASLFPGAVERRLARGSGGSDAAPARVRPEDSDDDAKAPAATGSPPLEPVRRSSSAVPPGGLRSPAASRRNAARAHSAQPRTTEPVVDTSLVTPDMAYRLDPNDELIIGKYVPGAELLPPKGAAVAAGKGKEGEPGSGMSAAAKAAAMARTYAAQRKGAPVRSAAKSRGSASRRGGGALSARASASLTAAARHQQSVRASRRGKTVVDDAADADNDLSHRTADGDSDVSDVDDDVNDAGDGAAQAHGDDVATDNVGQGPKLVIRGGPNAARPRRALTAEQSDRETLDVPCVASIFDGVEGHPSAATVLFPIAYPPPKKRDVTRRGTPQQINNSVHPPWPVGGPLATDPASLSGLPVNPPPGSNSHVVPWTERAETTPAAATATATDVVPCPRLMQMRLKRHNANVVPLYRIGPGAVAFRVVTQAFESSGAAYTPGGVFDYHVPRLTADDALNHFEMPQEFIDKPPPESGGWYVPRDPHSPNRSTAASFNVIWAKRADMSVHGRMSRYQRINHFPGSWGIGRKDNLHKNTSRMRTLFGAAEFDITPRTFLCPAESPLLEADAEEHRRKHGGAEPTYIVKPVASSCGKGIRVVKGVPQSLRASPTQPAQSAGQSIAESAAASKPFIVQQYVDPFLVDGRKFDLRMYVVMTGVDPLRIYLFDQGLVRFAAERYPGADALLENTWAHLTNYAVNKTAALRKDSEHLDAEETDEPVDIKWMLSDLRDHFINTTRDRVPPPTPADIKRANELTNNRPTQRDVRTVQWARVMRNCKDAIVKTILLIESEIRSQVKRQCRDPTGRGCFELFGFDLMLDSALNAKVIEVNIMPSLATAENVDKAVKGRMLAHLNTLIGVVPFDRAAERQRRSSPLYARHAAEWGDSVTGCVSYTSRYLALEANRQAKRVRAAAAAARAAPGADAPPTEDDDDDEYVSSTDEVLLGDAAPRNAGTRAAAAKPPRASASDSDGDGPRGASRGGARRSSSATRVPVPLPPQPGTPRGGGRQASPATVVMGKPKNKPLIRIATNKLAAALRASNDVPLRHEPLPGASAAEAAEDPWKTLSLSDVRMIIEAEEELQRSGGFERLYPTPATHRRYSHLFSEGLPRSNFVLASWEAAKEVLTAHATGAPPRSGVATAFNLLASASPSPAGTASAAATPAQ